MAQVPVTSVSLLKGLACSDSARWTEFVNLYEESMRAFLLAHYPSVEADDVIQETLLALTRKMPNYHYTPDLNGHFRNYLTGILRHKAEDAIRRRARENARRKGIADGAVPRTHADEDKAWKIEALNAALEQLLSDDAVSALHRQVFRHVALLHEKPKAVAEMFGLRRDTVDQIKHRCIERLQDLVAAMTDDL